MTNFNPLEHPVCLSFPNRVASTAWLGHVPFAMYLIDILRPRAVAELGTFYGVSYCAFCQAIKELGVEARCYAVDTWEGDAQTGFFGTEVLQELKEHHDPLYGGFSQLIRSTFDEALKYFPDDTFDLLHIDGFHTYDAVKDDFKKWLPKMTGRGVILFHDINVREREFGVWKFWGELKQEYPHFEFVHSYGLGVLAVGGDYPAVLKGLFDSSEEEAAAIRHFFSQLGTRLEAAQESQALRRSVKELTAAKKKAEEDEHERLRERDTQIHEKNLQLNSIALERDRQLRERDTQIHEKNLRIADLVRQHEERVRERDTQIHEKNLQLNSIALERDQQLRERDTLIHEKNLRIQELTRRLEEASEQGRAGEDSAREGEEQLKDVTRRLDDLSLRLRLTERRLQFKSDQLAAAEHREQEARRQLENKDRQLQEVSNRLPELRRELELASRAIQERDNLIQAKERHIDLYAKTVDDFGRSGSYRLGRALTWPLRAAGLAGGDENGGYADGGVPRPEPPPVADSEVAAVDHGAEAAGDEPGVPEDPTPPAAQPAPPVAATAPAPQTDPSYDYELWTKLFDTLTDADRQAILERVERLDYKPVFSIVMPVYNVEEVWLRKAIESVRSQLYPLWELCVADDNSTQPHVRRVLDEYAAKDSRVRVTYRETNGHISAASNSALELATGDFVALLDNDDELPEHALYVLAEELNEHPEADLIYSDEDKIDEEGRRREPHFKPDWSPDYFYSCNMISHLGVYRTSVLKKIGGFRQGYEGSQDYDLALRFVEQIPEENIRHVPHVLYHWRAIAGSVALASGEKDYAHEAARRAIRSHLERKGVEATVTEGNYGFHRVSYPVPDPAPLVSLIVATRDRVELLSQTVRGLLDETDYEPLEVIIVDNQSAQAATLDFLRKIQADPRVRVIPYDAPFNYPSINNLGAREAKGSIIGLINNDIKVISPDWLKEMVGHALRPDVGAVGAKLLYPDATIQHAGVLLGIYGVAAHAHRHLPATAPGYINRAAVIQNFSAVTGACMILRREVFDEVGGLDEVNLPVAFNDVDFCIRIRERGHRIVWTPYAELYHLESASRGADDTPQNAPRFSKEVGYMLTVWKDALERDPYYNPNLTMVREDFSLANPPRAALKWKA